MIVKPSEQSVAEIVVYWLEALGADVYQEVAVSGGVADIVARVSAETWIIEVKTSLSVALLIQAMDRRRDAHRVYVAAPYSRTSRDFGALCAEIGVGLLTIHDGEIESANNWDHPTVNIEVASLRHNTRPVALTARLRPEHKTHARAGAIGGGGRWTPWRDTCEQLARIVRGQPGITLEAAIDRMTHHYRSAAGARSSLAKWIEIGKVPGVRLNRQTTPASLEVAP